MTPDGWKMVLHDTDACLLFDRNKDPLEMNNLYYSPSTPPPCGNFAAGSRSFNAGPTTRCSCPRRAPPRHRPDENRRAFQGDSDDRRSSRSVSDRCEDENCCAAARRYGRNSWVQ